MGREVHGGEMEEEEEANVLETMYDGKGSRALSLGSGS